MLDTGSAGVVSGGGWNVSDTGYWILDAGSAGVVEKTVSAWKDAGAGVVVMPGGPEDTKKNVQRSTFKCW
ncbi:MAG: hypothetical protein QF437_02500, partial [Planctomycetota bacterium]|jgi:hypothetical protein|nr:hypothetical protein [Planctomycetota bacterium]